MAKLTIGMSVFEDFHGAYFSIQALRLANQDILDDLESWAQRNSKHKDKATGRHYYFNNATIATIF